jgi:hypothetical protein
MLVEAMLDPASTVKTTELWRKLVGVSWGAWLARMWVHRLIVRWRDIWAPGVGS